MLHKYYRLRFRNESGQTMTFNDGAAVVARLAPWKFASGVLTYGTTVVEDFGFGTGDTIADDAESEGSVIDNTSNLFLGIKGALIVTHDLATASGSYYLFLEESDDNSNWPSDTALFAASKQLRAIAAISITATAVDQDISVNFEF